MQLSELVTAVDEILDDASITSTRIKSRLNEAQKEIAGGVQSSLGNWITPPLPGLLTIDTITTETDAAYVTMPTTFQRNLQLAASSNGVEIDIAESFISFSEVYPLLDNPGAVTECCEFGGNFYYQGIPTSAETITLHFYRFPVDMSDDTDTPDGIPTHLHRGLLVNHACWKFFELLEDGAEGNRPNTDKYMALFMIATKLLELTIPYENRNLRLR
ncbi:MAG: hypothetical protein SVO01_00170 [Thermotogota bacterium]|nr:hypothetical protein [Thermotogota bacterium]